MIKCVLVIQPNAFLFLHVSAIIISKEKDIFCYNYNLSTDLVTTKKRAHLLPDMPLCLKPCIKFALESDKLFLLWQL